jgi:translation initiation factor 5A
MSTAAEEAELNADFETGNAGGSLTFPMQCSALRKNGHVVIKGRPCKIIDMSTSKTGKHGHAKVHLIATDIFTGKKLEDLSPSTHNMDVPNVVRSEYQLVNVDDGFLNLMTQDGTSKDDVRVPEGELGDKIQADFDDGKDLLVTIVSAMGEEMAMSVKEVCSLLYFAFTNLTRLPSKSLRNLIHLHHIPSSSFYSPCFFHCPCHVLVSPSLYLE